MNSETAPDRSRFPTLRRLLRFVFSWRMVYLLAAFATFIALVYAEENLRGKRAWNRYRQDAEARGVKLDFATLIPPPIPDEQNGANTPFIRSWFPKPKPDDTNQWPTLFSDADHLVVIKRRTKGPGSQDDRGLTDLTAWQEAFARLKEPQSKTVKSIERESHGMELDPKQQAEAARAVLDELKIYEPVLAKLRIASRHPQVRYPVEYKMDEPYAILLPHLAKTKGLVNELRFQASAELAAGQTDRAFEDLRLLFWFADSLKEEGFLISQLVRIAEQQLATQPIWEGLTRHQWSDAQLKEMQGRLLRVNFAESINLSMGAERSAGLAVAQNVIKRNNLGETLNAIGSPESEAPMMQSKWVNQLLGWFVPRGWVYFEMVNHASMMDGLIANGWDAPAKVFHPRTLDRNEKNFEDRLQVVSSVWNHQVLARLLLPALTRACVRFSRGQATANQVALACALERYHLKQGAYPESLSQLVPQYLAKIPNEVVSEDPMKYLRTADGYVLYSVGWDGVDNGGAFLKHKEGEPDKGDWVWRIDAP